MTTLLWLTLGLFLAVFIIAVSIITTRNKHYKEFCKRLDRDIENLKKDMDNGR